MIQRLIAVFLLGAHLDTTKGQAAAAAAATASPPPSAHTRALLNPDISPEDMSEEPDRDGIIISMSAAIPSPAALPATLSTLIVAPES